MRKCKMVGLVAVIATLVVGLFGGTAMAHATVQTPPTVRVDVARGGDEASAAQALEDKLRKEERKEDSRAARKALYRLENFEWLSDIVRHHLDGANKTTGAYGSTTCVTSFVDGEIVIVNIQLFTSSGFTQVDSVVKAREAERPVINRQIARRLGKRIIAKYKGQDDMETKIVKEIVQLQGQAQSAYNANLNAGQNPDAAAQAALDSVVGQWEKANP